MNYSYSAAVKRPTPEDLSDYSSACKFTRRLVMDSPDSPPPSASLDTHRGSQETKDYLPYKAPSGSPEYPLDFSSVLLGREERMPMGQLGLTAKEPENPNTHHLFTWAGYEEAEEIGTARIKTAYHFGLREKFFYIARKNLENRRPTVVRFSFVEAFKLKKLLELVLRQVEGLESKFDVIPLLSDNWDLATEKYQKHNEKHFFRITHLDTGTLKVRLLFSKVHGDYVIYLNNLPTPNMAATFPNWVGSVVSFTTINLIRRLRECLHTHLMLEEQ